MSRPCNPEILKAFNAMKEVGIKQDRVKPVLKRLLKLYDKKWELIKEDNYRVLADAIFENDEEKKEKAEINLSIDNDLPEPPLKNHCGMGQLSVEHDPSEPPFKKHHSMEDDVNASSRMDNGDMLDMKNGENESLRSPHKKQHVKKMMPSGSGSSSFVASQQHPASLSLSIPDISKETEAVRISLVDDTSGEKEPLPNFVYIPKNLVYQSAYVHVSLARIADEDCCYGCRGDCLSSTVPCACARDTGGEFAYTPEGLVKEEFLRKCILMNEKPQKDHFFYCQDCPLERARNDCRPRKCKGHLIRRFIKECWRKCGCNMSCGNRVVQRGISRKLQVFLTSDGKGWGVRTLEVLPKGAFVCEYVGEVLTNLELFERNKKNSKDRHTYPVLLDADWGSESVLKDEDALCLDATHFGNVARFINHRCCDANLIEIPVEVENPDHHYYHLAFFTKRKVNALEELTWDYQIDFADQNHPVKAFHCCCGSASCRDRKGKGHKTS